ncbi:emerin isoform 2-T3 [Leptodactylus fuscus]|uniref:emerin isoform X2 n=1 Tax=Leptodactylus fuscus TaxID=238119 RepID=UPI003F4E7775
MEKFRDMTDEELINTLKRHGIKHGPIVGTTRTLYEKKLYQYEREKNRVPQSSYESREHYSRRDYNDDDNDDSQIYEEEYIKTYQRPQAYQRSRDDLTNRSYSSNENTYQNISQSHFQSGYSQGVEARRPIRPKQKEEETPVKRFIPLWLQILLLLLFTAFLVYLYILQTDINPFKSIEGSL